MGAPYGRKWGGIPLLEGMSDTEIIFGLLQGCLQGLLQSSWIDFVIMPPAFF